MENNNEMGNATEDATQENKVQKYKEQMTALLALLQENEHALNKFADLHRDNFGELVMDSVTVETITIKMDKENTNTKIKLGQKNRFYALQEILGWFVEFVKKEGGVL